VINLITCLSYQDKSSRLAQDAILRKKSQFAILC
jgi:hypothetical protein